MLPGLLGRRPLERARLPTERSEGGSSSRAVAAAAAARAIGCMRDNGPGASRPVPAFAGRRPALGRLRCLAAGLVTALASAALAAHVRYRFARREPNSLHDYR